MVFGVGYGLGLGLFFGIVSGAATGITVAIELHRTGTRRDHYSLPWEALFSVIRAAAFGAGLYRTLGVRYAATFAALNTVGQIVAYMNGMRPSMDYSAARRPRLTRRQIWGTVGRTLGFIAAAMACSALVRHVDHPWSFALRLGVVTGLVTTVGAMLNPYIEYFADNLPQRRLGVFGICLVVCGFLMQSFQYWVELLDVAVR
jgi:CDP-diglyceride synthetase